MEMRLYSNIIKVLAVLCFPSVSAFNYNISEEGYIAGYLPYCPDSFKPIVLRPGQLAHLTIYTIGTSEEWTEYNYQNINQLANHPGINLKKKTFLYISGFLDMRTIPFGTTLAKAYRNLGYNVMILDTLKFTSNSFPKTARFIQPIGKHVAGMLANLTTVGLNPKRLEVVGLSSGAQTMSFIAKTYRQITGRNISSLTALDPMGPCFRRLGPQQRLDPSDADFVLNIVTNSDGFGMTTPLGHVTFYPNGGEYQPGELWFLPCTQECSHVKAYFFWLAAVVNPNLFIGMKCDSIQQAKDNNCYDRVPMVTNTMDRFVDKNKPGIYYVATFHRYPYGLGKQGLKREGNEVFKHLNLYNEADVLIV